VLAVGHLPHAAADDGRREINQASALAGCFPGDSAGFPVVVTTPGSYVLTSSLSVTDPDQHGISIESALGDVFTLDLNGFTIAGPVSCSGSANSLTCGAGAGRAISTSTGVVVQDGRVTGFGGGGISSGPRSRIDGVIADANGQFGIVTGDHSLVRHSSALRNAGHGIWVDGGSIIESSVGADNRWAGLISHPPWDLSSFDASTAPLGYLDYVDVFSSATTPGEDEEPFGIATLTLQATAVGVASIALGPGLVGWSVFGGRYTGVSYGAASVEIVPVPEPTTAALGSCGLCLLAAIRTSIRPCVRGSKERR
jgi:hypothetical protein